MTTARNFSFRKTALLKMLTAQKFDNGFTIYDVSELTNESTSTCTAYLRILREYGYVVRTEAIPSKRESVTTWRMIVTDEGYEAALEYQRTWEAAIKFAENN